MRISYILLILLLLPGFLLSQSKQNEGIRLSKSDSVYAVTLPKLNLPDYYKSSKAPVLAYEHDNSQLPFFRPAFSQQQYWNCGQSASVGYNFTYEINAAREADGSLPENQYSPNFTFNFMNNGDGWGVNYFNTYEAIKRCGNPNLEDYGELFNAGYEGWKSGYELYENAMRNRVTDIYAIDVGTPEGLNVLKYWLLDHLNGSTYGGTANFYFGWNWSGSLPEASPYSGFQVVIESHELATHAMTIVGWNDSIRYDVNGDGMYTNDLDINGDGIVDMQDWEIGGLKYTNSTTHNDGQGFMLYRTLAIPSGQGGIWNNQVHVIKVDANYIPLGTMRVKIKHNSRNKIKLIAGVSENMDDNYPEHTMDFPLFNFQGGDHFMQGFDTTEIQKELELSLDISPLFTYLTQNEPAKFFLQVAEKDDKNMGEGEILHYSLQLGSGISSGGVVCTEVPTPIVDNSVTTLQVEYSPDFEKVSIENESITNPTIGQLQEYNLVASGGYPPYSWETSFPYICNPIPSDFKEISDYQLTFDSDREDGVEVELPFSFPFYGENYNKVTAYIDGFLGFVDKDFPHPYFVGEDAMITNNKVIAAFLGDLWLQDYKGDAVWTEVSNDKVVFRWKASAERYAKRTEVNFNIVIYPDGKIDVHYDEMDFADFQIWTSGISNGDKMNYLLNGFNQDYNHIQNKSFRYEKAGEVPDFIEIDNTGKLSLEINDPNIIYPITVRVKDSKNICSTKTYNVSSSGITFDYLINNTETRYIDFNEESPLTIFVHNNSGNMLSDVNIKLTSNDSNINISEELINVGDIPAGQSKSLENITLISVEEFVSDNYGVLINCEISSGNSIVSSKIHLIVRAPDLVIQESRIINDDDGFLYPGENAKVNITVQNVGHGSSQEYELTLSCDDPNIYIPGFPKTISGLNPGDTNAAAFVIAANYNVSLGTEVKLTATLSNSESIVDVSTYDLRIGHIPALIIDLTPEQVTGNSIKTIFDELGLQNTLMNTMTNKLDDYLSVYICLGGLFNLIDLSEKEENLITDYLLNGGNVYLEGMSKWQEIEESEMLQLFGIRADLPSTIIHWIQLLEQVIYTLKI